MIPLRLLYLVNVVLALLLGYLSYSTLHAFMRPEKRKRPEMVKESATPTPPGKPAITEARYQIIEKANIFKNKDVVPTRPPEQVPTPTPPPLPKLELELKGTNIWPRTGSMKAIIFNKKTKKTDHYSINDVLPDTDGAKLIEIHRTSVVLDRQGTRETLELYPSDQDLLKKGGDAKSLRRP